MRERLVGALLGGSLLVLGACSEGARETAEPAGAEPPTTAPATTVAPPPTTDPPTTDPPVTSSTSTTTTTSTTIPSTTTTEATTTTSTAPPLPATANPPCVVAINPGDTLEVIVAAVASDTVSVESLQAENEIVDPASIAPGGFLDICIGNAMNDVSGEQRVPPTTVPPALAGVQAQQQKLNELFAGYGLPPLAVDGDSGRSPSSNCAPPGWHSTCRSAAPTSSRAAPRSRR